MKNISKILFLMMLAAVSSMFVGCKEDIVDPPVVDSSNTVYHSGYITADETWSASKIHVLQDRVIVKSGVELTIEPGTLIKGEVGTGANASVLIIARGATINAAGTATNPIIFTSIADEIALGEKVGKNLDIETAKGFWGGVIILGAAPVSPKTGTTEQIEGVPGDVIEGEYGGSLPEDNSGIFTYVSIRHGGALIGEGNEINGLTLGGVGSKTTIHHIEIVGNVDDGIEFFGGTVNVSSAIVMYQGDDGFDVDQSYAGTLDNFIYIGGATSDHALEIDGPEGSANASGRFTFKNGSLKGNPTQGEFADFRSSAQGTVEKLYFFGFNSEADIELDDDNSSKHYLTDGTLVITDNKFNSTAWTLDGDGQPDGGTTTWSDIKSIFSDKSANGDATAADTKFAGAGNALVTSKENGANASEFAGWSLADQVGLLADF